jgi:hypothetical protein
VVFAEEARAMLAAAPDGPLRGVPVTLKDMFSTPWRGAHSGTSRELLPAGASGVFARLRDAGAVVVGVAQQHELGMGTTGRASVWGPVRNPRDPARCAGGSSRRVGGRGRGAARCGLDRQRQRRVHADPGRLLRCGGSEDDVGLGAARGLHRRRVDVLRGRRVRARRD